MSKGKIDKSKRYHKVGYLHTEIDELNDDSIYYERKINRRKGQIKRLSDRPAGNNKLERDW